jgi:peptide-N4-(N-acetyl-beta-glucosaminyl)asparagine amidase
MDSTVTRAQEGGSFLTITPSRTKLKEFLHINKKPQLTHPEDSVGELCGKKNGKLCWKAKGIALDAYMKRSLLIRNHLNSFKDEVEGSDFVTFMLYMIGKSPNKARPVIMFACPRKKARISAVERIRKSGIVEEWMGVGHWDFPPDIPFPRQLGGSDREFTTMDLGSMASESFQPRVMQFSTWNAFDNPSTMQRGTVGAIIQTATKSFYFTANHPFTKPNYQDSPSNMPLNDDNDSECDFGNEECDSESDLDEDVVKPTVVRTESPPSKSLRSMTAALSQAVGQPIKELQRSMKSVTMNLSNSTLQSSAPPIISDKLKKFEMRNSNQLVSFSAQNRCRYSADLDYALIRINHATPVAAYIDSAQILCSAEGIPIISSEMVSDIPTQDVPVLTITKPGGVIRGTLSGIPSYTKLPGSKIFQETFTVKFKGQIHSGDCGACVLDTNGRRLFGHIVAGSTDSNVAYIVPAVNVFKHAELLSSGFVPVEEAIDSSSWQRAFNDTLDPGIEEEWEQSIEIEAKSRDIPQPAAFSPNAMETQTMTEKFQHILSSKRKDKLSRVRKNLFLSTSLSLDTDGAHSAVAPPPSYTVREKSWNLPLVPTPPNSDYLNRFRDVLQKLSNIPMTWENPGLLDEALQSIPLERIYAGAEEETQVYQVMAETGSSNQPRIPEWAYQDCLVKSLLSWFKGRFFTWVNSPWCPQCGSATKGLGITVPEEEEKAHSAHSVELYQCKNLSCKAYVRFPRYNDAFVLLQTKRGRGGEWAICFGMLCRALGLRVRLVWNSEDHIWIEYYSGYRKRWVHVDPCEGWFDQPKSYTQGMPPYSGLVVGTT